MHSSAVICSLNKDFFPVKYCCFCRHSIMKTTFPSLCVMLISNLTFGQLSLWNVGALKYTVHCATILNLCCSAFKTSVDSVNWRHLFIITRAFSNMLRFELGPQPISPEVHKTESACRYWVKYIREKTCIITEQTKHYSLIGSERMKLGSGCEGAAWSVSCCLWQAEWMGWVSEEAWFDDGFKVVAHAMMVFQRKRENYNVVAYEEQ